MNKKDGSQSIVNIALVVLVLVFVSLSGYLYLKGGNVSEDTSKDSKVAELTNKLRQYKYNRPVKDTSVLKVDSGAGTVTIMDVDKKEVTLSVTEESDIKKFVPSDNKKFRKMAEATLSDIKEGSKISVVYNGLDEIVYLAVE